MINISLYLGWSLITPVVLVQSLIAKSYNESILLLFTMVIFIPIYYLNTNGKTQHAAIGLLTYTTTLSYFAVYLARIQIGAPYFDIAFGTAALFFIKNRYVKTAVAIYAFSSFLFLNYYQISNYPLELGGFATISLMLIVLYIVTILFESENSHYQKELEVKNQALKSQNQTIKKQSEQLLQLEKDYYEKELALKQKDIDQVLANNRMQLRIRENLLKQLEKVTNEKDSLKLINSMKFDLRAQIQTQKKLEFTEEHIQKLNAEFYDRLGTEFPKLTKKEVELCSYIKLGLSTKEIAHLLSTTENTVYVTKNRLRTKLNLDNNEAVDQFLKEI